MSCQPGRTERCCPRRCQVDQLAVAAGSLEHHLQSRLAGETAGTRSAKSRVERRGGRAIFGTRGPQGRTWPRHTAGCSGECGRPRRRRCRGYPPGRALLRTSICAGVRCAPYPRRAKPPSGLGVQPRPHALQMTAERVGPGLEPCISCTRRRRSLALRPRSAPPPACRGPDREGRPLRPPSKPQPASTRPRGILAEGPRPWWTQPGWQIEAAAVGPGWARGTALRADSPFLATGRAMGRSSRNRPAAECPGR